ncbi:MAG: hypothetical protein RLZ97_1094 [Verrucomicrobiota bacterium]
MSESLPVEEFTRVESIFVRHRNILAVRAQLTPVYTDYYLHLMQFGLRQGAELDQMLKDLLAGLTLHLVARPWAETIAWTANLRAPRVNFFVTGGSTQESITGRLFTEDVRETDRDLFYSQTLARPGAEARVSTLPIDGRDPLKWVEQYYTQSEQRPARLFRLADETFVLLAAQPDYDAEWLDSLTADQVAALEETEETKLLETRRFRFHCGCDLGKILPILGTWRSRPEELFEDAESIIVQCPRCAANYEITRSMLDGID